MIPPLLMNLRPGMTVLDLCAAPGSKSAQLIEMVHRGEEARMSKVMKSFLGENGQQATSDPDEEEAAKLEADPSDDGRATGIVIANDMDYKRSHMLIHQLKRLSSPNLIVTNHDATMFPPIRVPSKDGSSKVTYLKFDRILADVPCSGDGTLRKNINMWRDWQPGNALGLHVTQVRILVRALQMLKVGGRVVYSTCSMNPIENEAVVAAAIERCWGPENIEIVDCKDQLPLLKRREGLKDWKIMDKSGRIWNSWNEVAEYAGNTADGVIPSRLSESMFPRPDLDMWTDLHLDRCMRVYAHLQDTGGFFITVLEKKAEFKAKPEEAKKLTVPTNGVKRPHEEDGAANGEESKRAKMDGETETAPVEEPTKEETDPAEPEPAVEVEAPVTEPAAEPAAEPAVDDVEIEVEAVQEAAPPADEAAPANGANENGGRRKPNGVFEEPFKYLAADNGVIQEVSAFYGISSRFPTDRYMVRNAMGDPAKAIYYTNGLVRDILVANEGRGVKFIHGGVKMFVKQESPSAEVCRWRILAEGMPILHGYVGSERVIVLREKETLRKLLVEMFPMISDGQWARMGEIGEQVRDVALGCCVLRIEPDGSDPDFMEPMALPLWKSFQSLNLMLPKEDRSAMLLRIFNDTTPLINISKRMAAIQDEEKQAAERAEDGSVDPQLAEDAPSEDD
jgi:multisite-specific tRNA:(cytosine-C5)-methyltransferase